MDRQQLLCVKTCDRGVSITFIAPQCLTGRPAQVDVAHRSSVAPPTHGHSAALVERGGGTYVVFVGGGTGSILDDPARCQEHSIAQVLDVSTHAV